MCGIIGYLGKKKASEVILDGLKKLEYRGYDSSGICTYHQGSFHVKKDVGKIEDILKKQDLLSLEGHLGIGHCRWATHGGVTQINAHPHQSMNGLFTIVHNGIIENYAQIKNLLLEEGFVFVSQTDTEVVANLLEFHYQKTKDVLKTLGTVANLLEGSYSLVILCKDFPENMFALKQRSPLVLGLHFEEKEVIFASDIIPILYHTQKIIYLDNEEIVVVGRDFYDIYDKHLKRKQKVVHEIDSTEESVEKHGFDHFMLKEIMEQPDVVHRIIKSYVKDDNQSIDLSLSEDMKKILAKTKRFIFVACGTSWHSCLVGEFMFEELLRIPSEVEYSSEFRYRNPLVEEGSLIIALSQSGETADTLAAMEDMKERGVPILSILNNLQSSMSRLSDDSISIKAGVEIGVASTKAFVAQITTLYLLMLYIGKERSIFSPAQIRRRLENLRLIPFQIQEILESKDYIYSLAETYAQKTNALYLGRGINYPIALEGALKLKEISYIHAEGYPAAELKHGPIALIDENMPVLVVATKDNRTYEKIKSNIEEVRARKGEIIAITSKGDKEILRNVDRYIHIPQNSYLLTPILAIIPLQLLSYYIAIIRNLDPDKPRNLAKSVTVE